MNASKRLVWRRAEINNWYSGFDPDTDERIASIHKESGISSVGEWYWSINSAIDPRLRSGRSDTKQGAADMATKAWLSVR